MNEPEKKYSPAVSLGMTMAAGMAVFSYLGYLFDKKFNTRFGTLTGMFLGLFYCWYEVWKLIRQRKD